MTNSQILSVVNTVWTQISFLLAEPFMNVRNADAQTALSTLLSAGAESRA